MTQASRRAAAPSLLARHSPLIAVGVVLLAGCLTAFPLAAKTLRFASAFDPQSLDPHALALQYQTRVVSQIYESLVKGDNTLVAGTPESFNVLIKEIQSLGLDIKLSKRDALGFGS